MPPPGDFNTGAGRFAVWQRVAGGYITPMVRRKSSLVLWIVLGILVVLAAGTLLGVSMWVKRFLRSDDFRALVAAKTGEALRSDAIYGPMKWQGSSLFSDSLVAQGKPGSIVESLRADQIRAEVNWRAIRDGAWRVDRVDVVNFEATFRPGSPEEGEGAVAKTPLVSGFAAFLPKRFELGQLNIAQAQLGFRGADGAVSLALQNAALQVRPDGAGWAIDGNGGTFSLPNLPVFNITNFRSRIQGPTFFLTDASLRLDDNGKIKAAGEFAENSSLRVDWTQVDVATFLDAKWKSRLTGLFDGTAVLNWPEAGLPAGTVTGTFRMNDGLLQNLKMLDQIATFTGAPQFRRMSLQEVSGNYAWTKGVTSFTNLVLESKGLLRIEGNCALAADGALNGTLRVGVTPQTLQWLPGSRERVFTFAQNGYLWTDVRVGGTLSKPSEDLSARLAKAMGQQVIEQGEKVLDVLPGPAKEGAKGVLDALKPLIP